MKLVVKGNPERLEATPGKLLPIMVKAIQELEEKFQNLFDRVGKIELKLAT